MTAPPARRRCEVLAWRDSGAFRVLSVLDREGAEPEPGQSYALAAEERGDGSGRPLPLLPVAETTPAVAGGVRLDFLLDPGAPWAAGISPLVEGDTASVDGPLDDPFAPPRAVLAGAAGAVLVGAGVEVAGLSLWRRRLSERGVPHRVLLGFRDRAHTGGLDLFCGSSGALCPEVRLATEDGHAGHHGPVTDLLASILAGDDAGSGVVYGCGPPAVLGSIEALCGERGVAFRPGPQPSRLTSTRG